MRKLWKLSNVIMLTILFFIITSIAPLKATPVLAETEVEDTEEVDDSEDDSDDEWDEDSDSEDEDYEEEEEDGDLYFKDYDLSYKLKKVYTLDVENTTGQKLIFMSTNKEVATVSETGKVTTKKPGKTIIKVKSEDGVYTDTCDVSVVGISLNSYKLSLNRGKTFSITELNTTKQKLIYTSSKKTIATISKTGLIKAKKVGSTIITVKSKDGKFTAKCTLKVKK